MSKAEAIASYVNQWKQENLDEGDIKAATYCCVDLFYGPGSIDDEDYEGFQRSINRLKPKFSNLQTVEFEGYILSKKELMKYALGSLVEYF